jgi:hypothetical protein
MMPKPIIPEALRGKVQSQDWPGNKAILLVHGIGDAKPGDYKELTKAVRDALGPTADEFAIYQLFYDSINDWFGEKVKIQEKLAVMLDFVRAKMDPSDLAESMIEVVGDVLWPVLSLSARMAVRELYLAQLKMMVLDGMRAGVDPVDMNLNIIGHSLGCFHTYEAVHAAARYPSHRLQPGTYGVRFQNVILMASPVQLIRTVAQGMGPLVSKRWSATLDDGGLAIPAQKVRRSVAQSIVNFVSITGRLDPVGGHFVRTKADWAYMDVPGQHSIIDPQDLLNLGDDADLASVLRSSLGKRRAPKIGINNPHSWTAYVRNHETELKQWLNA